MKTDFKDFLEEKIIKNRIDAIFKRLRYKRYCEIRFNEHEWQDIYCEVLIKTFDKLKLFDRTKGSFKGFLFALVKNNFLNSTRDRFTKNGEHSLKKNFHLPLLTKEVEIGCDGDYEIQYSPDVIDTNANENDLIISKEQFLESFNHFCNLYCKNKTNHKTLKMFKERSEGLTYARIARRNKLGIEKTYQRVRKLSIKFKKFIQHAQSS